MISSEELERRKSLSCTADVLREAGIKEVTAYNGETYFDCQEGGYMSVDEYLTFCLYCDAKAKLKNISPYEVVFKELFGSVR